MTSSSCDGVVTFEFYRPGVSEIKVLGTFNGWCGDALPMSNLGNGWWSTKVELPPGEYRFRYQADGEWFTDFAANGVENGKYGWNSVLIVSEQKQMKMRSVMDAVSEDQMPLRISGRDNVRVAA